MEFEFQQPVFKEMTQQPLTEKIAKIHHDNSLFYQKKSYSKDQNKAKFKNLDNF